MDRADVGVRKMEIKESQFVLCMCLSYESLVGIWFPVLHMHIQRQFSKETMLILWPPSEPLLTISLVSPFTLPQELLENMLQMQAR